LLGAPSGFTNMGNERCSGTNTTMDGTYVAYYRVSTAKQERSGLGLEAQKAAVAQYLNGGAWALLGAYTEVESGKRDARPELSKAMLHCKRTGATLVVAKLDRLSRDVAFLANLMKTKVPFVACDNPHATPFTIHILAAVAQHEREAISARTRAALAMSTKKLGGWRGGPPGDPTAARAALVEKAQAFRADIAPMASDLRAQGLSLRQIAASLTTDGIRTPRGGAWTASGVNRLLDPSPRLDTPPK
jgi:DNA invertase Pin-like site-specific DNA recombinase